MNSESWTQLSGFSCIRNIHATPALRKAVIDAVVKKSLSYAEVIAMYGISFISLNRWLCKYRHGGYEGMSELGRFREERLPKKLKALDQKENAEMFGIGPRSSAN